MTDVHLACAIFGLVFGLVFGYAKGRADYER
jgi:hypothetical protein